jgi:hypothetical protein
MLGYEKKKRRTRGDLGRHPMNQFDRDAELFRQRAEQFLIQAEDATSPSTREAFERLAHLYDILVERTERRAAESRRADSAKK